MSESKSEAFEKSLTELESILKSLEDGSTTLEENLNSYERGVGLLKQCYSQLRNAEQKIVSLTGVDEAGNPVTQPFQHSASDMISETPVKRKTSTRTKPPEKDGLY